MAASQTVRIFWRWIYGWFMDIIKQAVGMFCFHFNIKLLVFHDLFIMGLFVVVVF